MARFETDRDFNLFMLETLDVPQDVIDYIKENHSYILDDWFMPESVKEGSRKFYKQDYEYVQDYNSMQEFSESIYNINQTGYDEGFSILGDAVYGAENLERLINKYPNFKKFMMNRKRI